MPKIIIQLFLILILTNNLLAQDSYPEMETLSPRSEGQPALAPDGRSVLYSEGNGFNRNLFIRNIESQAVKQITDTYCEDSHARWSPDGKQIVFQREDSLGNRDLWILSLDNGEARNMTNTPDKREQHPRFSPDGSSIVFDSNRDEESAGTDPQNYEIYAFDIESKVISRLTNWDGWDMYASYSPDKSQIVLRRALTNSGDRNFEIFVKNLATGKEINITNHEAYDSNPHWSPMGDKIVFASNRDGSFNLYLINPDGSGLKKITQAEGRSIGFSIPTFAYGGEKIVANRYTKGVSDIVQIDLTDNP